MPPHISLLDPDTAALHRSRLLAVARSLCGSPQLAEGLTQETYARVLAKPRRLNDGADFPYLVRALRNVANDHWRSEQRRPQTARSPRIPPGTVMSRLSRGRSRLQ